MKSDSYSVCAYIELYKYIDVYVIYTYHIIFFHIVFYLILYSYCYYSTRWVWFSMQIFPDAICLFLLEIWDLGFGKPAAPENRRKGSHLPTPHLSGTNS